MRFKEPWNWVPSPAADEKLLEEKAWAEGRAAIFFDGIIIFLKFCSYYFSLSNVEEVLLVPYILKFNLSSWTGFTKGFDTINTRNENKFILTFLFYALKEFLFTS